MDKPKRISDDEIAQALARNAGDLVHAATDLPIDYRALCRRVQSRDTLKALVAYRKPPKGGRASSGPKCDQRVVSVQQAVPKAFLDGVTKALQENFQPLYLLRMAPKVILACAEKTIASIQERERGLPGVRKRAALDELERALAIVQQSSRELDQVADGEYGDLQDDWGEPSEGDIAGDSG